MDNPSRKDPDDEALSRDAAERLADAEYEDLMNLIAASADAPSADAAAAPGLIDYSAGYGNETAALHAEIWRLREDGVAWNVIAARLGISEPRLAKLRVVALQLGLAVKEGGRVRWLPPRSAAAQPLSARRPAQLSSESAGQPATTCWGIHGRRPQFEMVRDGQLVLERAGVGNLAAFGGDCSAIEAALRVSYAAEPEERLRSWARVLARFCDGPSVGDLVAHPDPVRRTVSIGRVTGDYASDPRTPARHTRSVTWTLTELPRDDFSQEARKGLSQLVAFFEIRRGTDELLERLRAA